MEGQRLRESLASVVPHWRRGARSPGADTVRLEEGIEHWGWLAAVQKRLRRLSLVLLFALPAIMIGYRKAFPDTRNRIKNPLIAPVSMDGEGGGPQSPFFPASAKTNVGGIIPSNFFMDSATCGECHKKIYEEWKGSSHHFGSFNNQFYRKAIENMQETQGTTKGSKWCAGCHDHAVFFNGRFDKPIKDQIDTPQAQAGLACTSVSRHRACRQHHGQWTDSPSSIPPCIS